jgi:hypothetical protein
MKKFLISSLLIVCSLVSIGQTFATAKYYQLGIIDTLTMEVKWQEKVKMEPALVSFNSRNLKIHTEKFQQYFYKSQKYDLYEVKGYYYQSYSADGKECVIYIYNEDDGSNYVEIEHKNYIIKYSLVDLE